MPNFRAKQLPMGDKLCLQAPAIPMQPLLSPEAPYGAALPPLSLLAAPEAAPTPWTAPSQTVFAGAPHPLLDVVHAGSLSPADLRQEALPARCTKCTTVLQHKLPVTLLRLDNMLAARCLLLCSFRAQGQHAQAYKQTIRAQSDMQVTWEGGA